MSRNVLMDAASLVLRQGRSFLPGIGRTTADLIAALQYAGKLEFDIVLYTRTIRGRLFLDPSGFRHINIPLPNHHWLNRLFLRYSLIERMVPHDLLHVPHNHAVVADPGKTVVTIHDAMFFSYPEEFLGHAYAREHYPVLAQASRGIITCSLSSKEDIVTYMGIEPEKITVAPWGVNTEVFYPSDKNQVFRSLNGNGVVHRPYFLFVSCDVGRKNTHTVMKAFKNALQSGIGHDLILAWSNPPAAYLQEFSSEISAQRIRFVANINDALLRQYYTASTLSWFPSRYEGFGLPVLESMACGTPVVTCRNSSLVEVGGNAALYVDPDDIDAMTDLMLAFDIGWTGYDELVRRSLQHAATFTWERTARQYIEFYKKHL